MQAIAKHFLVVRIILGDKSCSSQNTGKLPPHSAKMYFFNVLMGTIKIDLSIYSTIVSAKVIQHTHTSLCMQALMTFQSSKKKQHEFLRIVGRIKT